MRHSGFKLVRMTRRGAGQGTLTALLQKRPFSRSFSHPRKSLVLDRSKNLVQKEPMKPGYARVSAEKQRLDLQIEALTEDGCERIISDKGQSGVRTAEEGPGFSEAMDKLGPGDLLVVWKLDRGGRSIADLIQERTKASLRAANKRDKTLGRLATLSPAQIKHAKDAIQARRETVSGMAEILGVNRSTIQRALGASS